MEKDEAIRSLSALAQSTRMSVFTVLSTEARDGMTAGELATRTGTPANTMSAHLAILSRSGLVTAERSGRHITYRAVLAAAQELMIYLLADCCGAGRGEATAAVAEVMRVGRGRAQ